MVKKINRLIIASVIGLIALSVIQGYLIRNSYILEKESFINKANKVISRIDDYTPAVDSINEVWQNLFVTTLDKYDAGVIKKERVLLRLRKITDSLNDSFVKEYNKELATKNLAYDLKFHKTLKNIVLYDSIKKDTLFKEVAHSPYRLLGDVFDHKGVNQISNSLWHTDRTGSITVDGKELEIGYELNFETQDYMDINGWQRIVFGNMSLLLILSFLIFAFVIGLLYYSIKNLITQKKIADIQTDFVNNITHELKTPLATLTLATKMLQTNKEVAHVETVVETVRTIERQNKRLQNLIDQVMYNSLGYKEIELHKEEVHLVTYLHTLLDDFLISINDKNVSIERVMEITSHKVCIDPFYYTTAVYNMLENAVKYGKDAVVIKVTVTCKNGFLLEIEDNGIGISSDDQQLIFNKFFRAGNKEIHNVKGLGLGLYYTRQIILAHNGSIEVDSATDSGTKFTVKIPFN